MQHKTVISTIHKDMIFAHSFSCKANLLEIFLHNFREYLYGKLQIFLELFYVDFHENLSYRNMRFFEKFNYFDHMIFNNFGI